MSWKHLVDCWERTLYFPSSVTSSFFSSCYMIPAPLLSKHIKFPAVSQWSRGRILGEQGTSGNLPPHLPGLQVFSGKALQKSFRPPRTKVSGMRGVTKRRGVILASFLSHRTREAGGCRLVGECADLGRKSGNWEVTGGSLVGDLCTWMTSENEQ